MKSYPHSDRILRQNAELVPGGASSLNRVAAPNIAFVRGSGSRLHDADGNEYIDYHGAFAAQLLGYNHPEVAGAVQQVLSNGSELFGAGPTEIEGELARLICSHVPWLEQVVFLNSGSEATAQAIRLARAATGRDHLIVMQGGYNGWHNDVACNLMTPLASLGPRRSPGEYDVHPISAGIPSAHSSLIHPVNFNDAESVRWVCERYPVGALILEPILQNVGLIKPLAGYLAALRALADEFGFVLIFDEIKTGFRYQLGSYPNAGGVIPDLVVYGKAIASGYPLAAIGGRRELMRYFAHEDPTKRVLLAGTYNAHPAPMAAALTTIKLLSRDTGAAYAHINGLAAQLQAGLEEIFAEQSIETTIVRQGSAFVPYFMDHAPVDWHDLAAHHDYPADRAFRRGLIENGVFVFPIETKQCSVSLAHTAEDVEKTLTAARKVVSEGLAVERVSAG